MAKPNIGEVQFPNLRPVEMQTPITAITDKTLAPKIKAKDSDPSRRQFEPTNREQLKSDVFTLDKDGKPLGVMTRAQRRKWDAANQDLMRKRKNDLLIANRNYGSGAIGTGSGQVMADKASTILSYLKDPNSRFGPYTYKSVNEEIVIQWLPDQKPPRGWIDIENPKGVKGSSGFRELMRRTLPELDALSEIPAKWEWNPDDLKKGRI